MILVGEMRDHENYPPLLPQLRPDLVMSTLHTTVADLTVSSTAVRHTPRTRSGRSCPRF
ncbi:MAG: hypothetical protein ACLVK8_01395 [Ruminococcus sp.]